MSMVHKRDERDTLIATLSESNKAKDKQIEKLRGALRPLVISGMHQMNDDTNQRYVEVSKSDIRRANKLLKYKLRDSGQYHDD